MKSISEYPPGQVEYPAAWPRTAVSPDRDPSVDEAEEESEEEVVVVEVAVVALAAVSSQTQGGLRDALPVGATGAAGAGGANTFTFTLMLAPAFEPAPPPRVGGGSTASSAK